MRQRCGQAGRLRRRGGVRRRVPGELHRQLRGSHARQRELCAHRRRAAIRRSTFAIGSTELGTKVAVPIDLGAAPAPGKLSSETIGDVVRGRGRIDRRRGLRGTAPATTSCRPAASRSSLTAVDATAAHGTLDVLAYVHALESHRLRRRRHRDARGGVLKAAALVVLGACGSSHIAADAAVDAAPVCVARLSGNFAETWTAADDSCAMFAAGVLSLTVMATTFDAPLAITIDARQRCGRRLLVRDDREVGCDRDADRRAQPVSVPRRRRGRAARRLHAVAGRGRPRYADARHVRPRAAVHRLRPEPRRDARPHLLMRRLVLIALAACHRPSSPPREGRRRRRARRAAAIGASPPVTITATVDSTRFVTREHMLAAGEMQISGEPLARGDGPRPRRATAAISCRPISTTIPNLGIVWIDLAGFSTAVESYEYSKQPMNNLAFESGAGTSLVYAPLVDTDGATGTAATAHLARSSSTSRPARTRSATCGGFPTVRYRSDRRRRTRSAGPASGRPRTCSRASIRRSIRRAPSRCTCSISSDDDSDERRPRCSAPTTSATRPRCTCAIARRRSIRRSRPAPTASRLEVRPVGPQLPAGHARRDRDRGRDGRDARSRQRRRARQHDRRHDAPASDGAGTYLGSSDIEGFQAQMFIARARQPRRRLARCGSRPPTARRSSGFATHRGRARVRLRAPLRWFPAQIAVTETDDGSGFPASRVRARVGEQRACSI